jgi:hypothetical protein
MRPETESLGGLGDSLAKAMRCYARMAFCLLWSDRKCLTAKWEPWVNGRFAMASSEIVAEKGTRSDRLTYVCRPLTQTPLNDLA